MGLEIAQTTPAFVALGIPSVMFLGPHVGAQQPFGYGTYFGKRLDPEPGPAHGRKEVAVLQRGRPGLHCERHMHRGRKRSRKPVETQPAPQSQPPAAGAAAAANGSSFRNHSLYPAIAGGGGGGASSISAPPFSSIESRLSCTWTVLLPAAALGGGGGGAQGVK
eukprot:XP_008680580.1 growth-regulating factor 4-like [Zea mays]